MRIRDLFRDRAVMLLTLVVAAMFYRPLATETFYFRDLYHLFYPKKVLWIDAVRSGIVPLWDQFTHGGQPYLALPPNYAWHPSNLLYLLLPVLFAFNLILVLHVLLCAVAAYWLGRTIGLSTSSAFIAGAAFAFCGYTLSTANLTHPLLGLPWIPLTIGLAHRSLRDGRSIAPAAVAAAMPLLAAAAELTAMLFVTLLVWFASQRDAGSRRARATAVAIVIAGGIGLSAIQTLPAISVIEQSSRRQKRTYESFTSWSVAPQRLPELVVPRFFGETDSLRDESYWGRHHETGGFPYILSLYVGIPVLLLAFAGALGRGVPVSAPRRAIAGLAAIALLLSLGRHLPLFRLIYELPFVTIFRFPVKAQIAMLLPVAVLAGCGAEQMMKSAVTRRRLLMASIALAAVSTAVASALFASEAFGAGLAHTVSFRTLDDSQRALLGWSFVHSALAAAGMATGAIFCGRDPRRGSMITAVVIAADLVVAGYGVNDYAPRTIFDKPPAADAVRSLVGTGRFHAARRQTIVPAPTNDLMWLAHWQIETLNDYAAAMFGIPVVFHSDYDGLAPARMSALGEVMERLPGPARRGLLDRADVRAYLGSDALPGMIEVAQLDVPGQPLRLYVNPTAAPARFVSSVEIAGDEPDALKRVIASESLSRVVMTGSPTQGGDCGTAPVRLADRSFHSGRYELNAPCRGWVVFAENHYDGWRVTVDGHEMPHVRADFAFTAVAVEPGPHVIERRYVPPGLWLGVGVSLSTTIVLVLIAVMAVTGPPESTAGTTPGSGA